MNVICGVLLIFFGLICIFYFKKLSDWLIKNTKYMFMFSYSKKLTRFNMVAVGIFWIGMGILLISDYFK